MTTTHQFEITRRALQRDIFLSVKRLMDYASITGFELPIPGTDPPLYISVGPHNSCENNEAEQR